MLLNNLNPFFRLFSKSDVPAKMQDKMLLEYNASRTISRKKYICHAPYNNMYFNSVGDVANCWLTFDNPEKYHEGRTIKEIWNGEKFSSLRSHIRQWDLEKRCSTCSYYIMNGNFGSPLAKAYDNNYPLTDYPTMMEFELSNLCNLECTMCNGLLSSAIRAKRERLPPLKSPYGAKFVNELIEFIPHLHEARFNGGEPFIIPIYYEIWEQIFIHNPKCKIVVATNGTAMNSRIKEFLEKGNFHFNISIDSLDAERYRTIRVNSDLNKVIENFHFLRNYCQSKNRSLCIMINPMRNNWQEMPDFVNFCNANNVHLWFNSIMHPEELALWNLPYNDLVNIQKALSEAKFKKPAQTTTAIYNYNVSTYWNLVNAQIAGWVKDARRKEVELDNENYLLPLEPKAMFAKKVLDYFAAQSLTVEQCRDSQQVVISKAERVKHLLDERVSASEFYSVLAKSSISEVVYSFLNEHDNVLVELYLQHRK